MRTDKYEPNLIKLSLEYLAHAFDKIECEQGRVIGVFGQKETLVTLRRFLEAVGRTNFGTLFGAPLIESPKVPRETLVFGAVEMARDTHPEDFVAALEFALRPQTKEAAAEKQDGEPVWGHLLRLS